MPGPELWSWPPRLNLVTPEVAPALSIVIPCFDAPEDLARCLAGFQAQDTRAPYEVIVVDSGLSDAVSEAARRAGVRVVRGSDKLKAGAARNLGARYARAARLAFVDTDTVPATSWLGEAVHCLDRGTELVGGSIVDQHFWHPVASVDNQLQFNNAGPGRPAGPVDYLPAAHLVMTRAAFDAVNGFPDDARGQDLRFTQAVAKQFPGKVRFEPALQVAHAGRRTLAEMLEHHRRFGEARGRLGLALKPSHQRWCKYHAAFPLIVLRRLVYVMSTTARWRPTALLRTLLYMPLLLLGLCAWTFGFIHGCRRADLVRRLRTSPSGGPNAHPKHGRPEPSAMSGEYAQRRPA